MRLAKGDTNGCVLFRRAHPVVIFGSCNEELLYVLRRRGGGHLPSLQGLRYRAEEVVEFILRHEKYSRRYRRGVPQRVLHVAGNREHSPWLSGGPSLWLTALPIDLQRSFKHVEDFRLSVAMKRDHNSWGRM